jgi:HlyD family secretion protein
MPALSNNKLTQILCSEGDEVQTGTILAVLDTLSFSIQKDELNALIQELEIQKKMSLLQLEQAKKDKQYTETKSKRTESLVSDQSLAEQNLDDITNVYEKSQTNYQVIQQQISLYDSKIRQIKAKLSLIDKNINDSVIKSPTNAFVNTIYAEENEIAGLNRPLIELNDMKSCTAYFYVVETDLPKFKTGDALKVFIDGSTKSFNAHIIKINSKSEFTPKQILTSENRTALVYGIKIQIDNAFPEIKNGMPIRIVRG